MCGNTVVILGKYEVGCVCWRDCPTQVAICSNPCLPWHSLTPSDPRIPPLFPEKNPWNAPQFPLSLSTPTNPSYPLFPRQYCSQNKLSVHVSAERQSSRAGGLRLTVRHPSPCLYTPRRKPASEPCTHRAQRARSESRFSKRQTLAVCSCRHAAVLREFQTLGEELFSSDIIINKTFGTNMSIYWTRNILQRLSAKMLFLWLNLWRICWLYESNPNPPIFEANSEILTSLWWAPSDL